MGDPPRRPRSLFLAGLAAAYLAAFASLYVQIPGLYGRDGILPARKVLRLSGKGLWEQFRDMPTVLWLGPRLGLDTEQGMELLCLLGALGSLGALLFEALRDSLLFALLWLLYLSLYQVGQVFLYFQWDSLLLEAGFLAVLVAPLRLLRGGSAAWRPHDGVTFWLVRWLLFRLMFASGVVKLTSRCPTWWGLTALTYHYETQCIPTPGAWFAHQLPVWFQKFSVVATYVIEIAVPVLFFAPTRRLRLFAFYCQVLLQLLIILTGNYNFFNVLTIVLASSLLDEEHVGRWLGRTRRRHSSAWPPSLRSLLSALLELSAYGLLLYGSIRCFGLEINWEKRLLDSKVAFTYHEFTTWLRTVTLPLVGLGFLSLSWEILVAMYRCACVRGFFWKLWAALQWAVFATATLGMFAVSLVPFTYIDYESNGKLWPGIHQMFNAVERYQVVNSYGLFRRMTGVGGRPEVVLEGSYDRQSWTEIEFMYKPGNVSRAPPVVVPHQPRLDWQMWFAALGPHTSSPWFTSFVHRLLQGQRDVIGLVQVDESLYPFISRPPVFIRARLYKYWFTGSAEGSLGPAQWWRRQHVQEFFPAVSLGDPALESLLSQHGLKDKPPLSRPADAILPRLLRSLRQLSRPCSGPVLLWSLYLVAATACVLRALRRRPRGGSPPARHKGPRRGEPADRGGRREERAGAEEGGGEGRGPGPGGHRWPRRRPGPGGHRWPWRRPPRLQEEEVAPGAGPAPSSPHGLMALPAAPSCPCHLPEGGSWLEGSSSPPAACPGRAPARSPARAFLHRAGSSAGRAFCPPPGSPRAVPGWGVLCAWGGMLCAGGGCAAPGGLHCALHRQLQPWAAPTLGSPPCSPARGSLGAASPALGAGLAVLRFPRLSTEHRGFL